MKTNGFNNGKKSLTLSLACIGLLSTMGTTTSVLAESITVDGTVTGPVANVSGDSVVIVQASGESGASLINATGNFSGGSITIQQGATLSGNINYAGSGGKTLTIDGTASNITAADLTGGANGSTWTIGTAGSINGIDITKGDYRQNKDLTITNRGSIFSNVSLGEVLTSGGNLTIDNYNNIGGDINITKYDNSGATLKIQNSDSKAVMGNINILSNTSANTSAANLSFINQGQMGKITITGDLGMKSGATSGLNIDNSGTLAGLQITGKLRVNSGGNTLVSINNRGSITDKISVNIISAHGANILISNTGTMNGFETNTLEIRHDSKSTAKVDINSDGDFGGFNVSSFLKIIGSGADAANQASLNIVSNKGNFGGVNLNNVEVYAGSLNITNNSDGSFGGLNISNIKYDAQSAGAVNILNTKGNFGDISIANNFTINNSKSSLSIANNNANATIGNVSFADGIDIASGGTININNSGTMGLVSVAGAVNLNSQSAVSMNFVNGANGVLNGIRIGSGVNVTANSAKDGAKSATFAINNSGTINSGISTGGVKVSSTSAGAASFVISNNNKSSIINGNIDLGVVSATASSSGAESTSASSIVSINNIGTINGTISATSVEVARGGKQSAQFKIDNNAGGKINAINLGQVTLNGGPSGSASDLLFGISNASGATINTINLNGITADKSNAAITNNGTIGALNLAGEHKVTSSGAISISNSKTGVISDITLQNGATFGETITINSNSISGQNDITTSISNAGSISRISNAGTISVDSFSNTGSIGSLSNTITTSKLIAGTEFKNTGVITALTNAGEITGTSLVNAGTISALSNTGTISALTSIADSDLILNTGVMGPITNAGKISLDNGKFTNKGTISTFINNGTLVARQLYNSGTITGGITNTGEFVKTGKIANQEKAVITNITNSGSLGSVENNGTITAIENRSGTINGIANQAKGTIASITNANSATIAGAISNLNTIGNIDNSGVVSGGISTTGINSSIASIANKGTINNGISVSNTGKIGVISNTNFIEGISVSGENSSITSIVNTGTINNGITLSNRGSIESISNSQRGVILKGGIVNNNNSTIGTLINAGIVSISNDGTIRNLTNTKTGSVVGSRVEYKGSGIVNSFNNSGDMYVSAPIALAAMQNETNDLGLFNNTGTIGAIEGSAIITNAGVAAGTVRVINDGKMLLSTNNASSHIRADGNKSTLNIEKWNLTIDKTAESFNKPNVQNVSAMSDSAIIVTGDEIGKITFAPQSIKINIGQAFEPGKAYALGSLVMKNNNGTLTQAGTAGTAAYQYDDETKQFIATDTKNFTNVVNNGEGLNVSHIVAANPIYTFEAASIVTDAATTGSNVNTKEDGFRIGVDVGEGVSAINSQRSLETLIRKNSYSQNILRGAVSTMQTQMRSASFAYADARMSEDYDTSSLSHYAAVGSDYRGVQNPVGIMNPQNRAILEEANSLSGSNNFVEVNNHAFIMPYYVNDSIDLTNGAKTRSNGYGVMLGYQRNAGSAGIFGVFAGFEMDDTYTKAYESRSRIDQDSNSIIGGISYYKDLTSGNTASMYLRGTGKVGVSNIKFKQNGDSEKVQEVTFGAEVGFGANIFATRSGTQIFTPELAVSYDHVATREFTLDGVKYDDAGLNLVLGQAGLTWSAQWLPAFRTEIGGGVRWNMNKKVDSKVILSNGLSVKDSIDMPELYSYGQASFIFSVNEFVDLSLNYTGSFSNKSQTHVGAFKVGFWW